MASHVHSHDAMRLGEAVRFAAIPALVLAAACTSSETSSNMTAPSAQKCQVTASGSPTSFPAGGGSGAVSVSADRDCTWSLTVDASWVAISGASSGQGNGNVGFSVGANPQPAARTANVAVNGQSVQLSQAAAPCTFALSRVSDTIPAAGGALSVAVTTLAGCNWTASSSAAWIAVASGASGSSSGTVGMQVAENGGAARIGQVNIGGQAYTVNQTSAAAYAPKPSPEPAPGHDPGPTPPPPAPPPDSGGDTEEFSGLEGNVSGICPNLVFNVASATIATDKSTKFKDISCGDVAKGGRNVSGEGTIDGNDVIHADIVKKAGGHD
ncbi:MAG TPA: BACON domain-containing carbohydrate-binding protein [Vicinamibacterales bacterium]|nr:BACON domain-containing carbohydrate-binding protein [Vicinamibacterales bacterium]